MNFESLDLNDDILDALYDMRFEKCTPIQENCIPEILKGKDVLGVAQTGTGKTAAYLLPVLSKLADGGYPEDAINCLIMSPTRELAQQIDQAIQGFSYYLNGVSCVAVYGGNDGNRYDQELKSLSLGANLVIATPGRFISHMSLGNVDLSKVSFFILDEADRMLDMGFSEDIMTIQKNLPKTCQTIMFSATMPKKIEDLAQTLLTNPSVIKLAVSKPAEKIHQLAYVCHETQKMGIIKDIFKAGNLQRVIIFSGSKQKVKQIALSLNQKKINCGQMHSDLAQAERDEMMFKFKSGQIDVLVATDILARGIDIDDIAMVINYDVPHDAEDYVHRIGRTARADRKGSAITFVNEDDIYYFQQIEKFLEKEVEKAELPEGLGEGLDYVSRNKERRKTSAKSRRRKDRDQQSHKDKKVRNNRRNNNQPTATNKTKKQDVKAEKVQEGKNEPAKSYKKNNNRKQRPTNFNGEVVETTDKQTPKKSQNRVQKDNKDSKTDKKQPQTVAETTNNKPKKKRPKKKKQPSFETNDTQRSSKYDMSEYFPKPKKEESGLKKLIKKPLKWLSNLGKK
ncbi:DEAD/DEAH box helicase [Prevotella disiens FB035-09AN]|uniref:DEAD/DEAH box helicase n=1 Tax=Prevotella disiens FB035-09AN TaxID=866771 RepID=E1KSF9_9BACT|nr:DEAD/DEAH box helicase [Prevotella disiens]EFL45693.1 DEAD/DEAH box helicase [Prevotella disiens FB035-09AN]